MRISVPPPTGHGLKATITWAEHAAHKDSDPQRCCVPFIPESASVSERATSLYLYILKLGVTWAPLAKNFTILLHFCVIFAKRYQLSGKLRVTLEAAYI